MFFFFFLPQGTWGGGNSETLFLLNYRLEGLYVRMRVRKARKRRQMVKQSKNITRYEILAIELLSGVDLSSCNSSSFQSPPHPSPSNKYLSIVPCAGAEVTAVNIT